MVSRKIFSINYRLVFANYPSGQVLLAEDYRSKETVLSRIKEFSSFQRLTLDQFDSNTWKLQAQDGSIKLIATVY